MRRKKKNKTQRKENAKGRDVKERTFLSALNVNQTFPGICKGKKG